MNKYFRGSIIGASLVVGLTMAGCSANEHSEQESFAFAGDTLNVVHDNAHMSVTASTEAAPAQGEEVTVEVSTQTMAQNPGTPAWSLRDGVLNLGSPCGGAVIGYCEGSYLITVPEGTEVLVNGQPTPVA